MTPLDTTTSLGAFEDARVAKGRLYRRERRRATLRTVPAGRVAIALPAIALALAACRDIPSPLAPREGAPDTPALGRGGAPGKPGSGEAVLFSGFRDGNADIYMMNRDGSNVRRVTTDSTVDQSPDFSPDNRKFAWVRRDETGNWGLFVAYTDGSKPTQIATVGTYMEMPRFSPDGTKIVFSAYAAGGQDIFVVNADGSGLKQLTYEKSPDWSPTWTPDGQSIAWVSSRAGLPTIYLMNADGLNVRPLVTWCVAGCLEPAFSPDGNKIAYTDLADNVIKVYDLWDDGIPQAVGPVNAGETRFPAWTKDGTQVLFASRRGAENTWELYVGTPGRTDGASVRRLTLFSPGSASEPAYSH